MKKLIHLNISSKLMWKFIFAGLLIVPNLCFGQWVESIGESAGFVAGNSVVADNAGNAYVTGISFVNEDNFGSDNPDSDTVTNFAQRKIFINKYDNIGNLIWSNALATDSLRAYANGIGIDAGNNVYISGFYQDSLKFNSGDFIYNDQEATLFFAKLATDGTVLWVRDVTVSASNTITPFNMAVNPSGDFFIAGTFVGDINIQGISISSAENQFFIAKFNTSGNVQWVETGTNASSGAYIADITLKNNDIYVTGNFKGSIDIGGTTYNASGGSSNIFIAKYNDGGTPVLEFAKTEEADTVNAISVDATNNILITGKYYNPATFFGPPDVNLTLSGGNSGLFAAKYDGTGSLIWAIDGQVGNGNVSGNGIGSDSNGNVYLTGTFGNGNAATTLTINGMVSNGFMDDDLFYAAFDPTGAVQWIQVSADSLNERSVDLYVGNDNQIYITGNYQDSVMIGNDIAGREFAGRKGFVAQIDICPSLISNITTVNEEICNGEITTLQANINPSYNYQWLKDKQPIIGATDNFLQVSDSGEYAVEIFDPGLLCAKISNRITIHPLPVPQPDIVLNTDSIICIGDTIAISTNASANTKFQWLRDGMPTGIADTLSSVKVFLSGLYQVIETNIHDCSTTSTGVTIEVLELPSKDITVNGDSVFCVGETRILQAEENPTYTYQWYVDNNMIDNETSSSIEVADAGAYHVSITQKGRCEVNSKEKNISVVAVPTNEITPSGPTTFCDGQFVTLFASTGINLTYQWFKDGQLLVNDTLNKISVFENGNFTVEITNQTGCKSISAPEIIEVLVNPVATLTVSRSEVICQGETVTLNADEQAGFSYQWRNYGTPIGDATSSGLEVSESGLYSVEVSNGACNDISESVFIEVNPLPDAFILAQGPTTFCEGNAVTLKANSGNNFSYQWFSTTTVNNSNQKEIIANASGKYWVEVTNSNNCSFTSDSVEVIVNPLPDALVEVEGNLSFCEGSSVTFHGVDQDGASYQWYQNSMKIDTATSVGLTIDVPGTYQLEVVSGDICTAKSQEFVIDVISNPQPEITFTENNLSTSLFSNYQWNLNDQPITGANNQIYPFEQSGNYSVTITHENGCQNTSEQLFICAPAPLIDANNDVLTASDGAFFQWYKDGELIEDATDQKYVVLEAGYYSVEITNGDGCISQSNEIFRCFPHPKIEVSPDYILVSSVGIDYQWYRNDIPIAGATSQTLQAIENGNYTVKVVSNESCEAISDPLRVLVTGIEDQNQTAFGFDVYPNPASNRITLDFHNKPGEQAHLLIYDMAGRMVIDKQFDQIRDIEEIDIQTLKNGAYQLLMVSGQEKKHQKLVVNK